MVGRKGNDEIRDKMAELVMVCDKESEIRQQRLQNATLSLRKSLRSSKSNADQTISINENVGKLKAESRVALSGMATQPREFFSKHNMLVSLDPTARGAEPYRQILEFLLRSRIFHVLTHSPTLMIDYVREFWRTARYDCVPNPPVIKARVNATDIAFSAVDIQAALQLGTDEQVNGPTEFSFELRVRAFQRMGYSGDVTKAQFTKSYLFGQWRYLMHVMIVSLSGRKAGFDVMGPKLQSAMISLVYNKPYSFSQYFFDEFVQQINAGGRERFLLYPRFVMMLLCRLLPNLPNLPQIVQVKSVDKRTFTDCMGHNSRHPVDQRPQPTALFGFLVDPAYVAPPNDGWLDVQQPNQPEGDVPAPDAAAEVQQPAQEVPQDAALENQEVIEEVLIQVKQRPQQGADPIIPAVAEEVVQHILQEGNAHDEPRVDDPEDDILEQVEAYRGDDDLLAQVDAYKGNDADDASAPRDGGKDIDMGGAGGNESKRDSVTVRKGSKVKSATVSDPHPESSSPIKRKAADLNYVRTKRVRRSGGVVISEPISIETTTPTATTTATPEFTASMATEMPSSIPSSSVPVFQVPDVLQCSELEGKFLILTARVNSLSSQWATQNVQHSEQVASLNKQVESSHQRVNSLEEEVEMLRRETVTQRRLNISQKERIGVLEAQCKNQSDFFQRLASQQQLQAGLLESVLQILGAQREKSSCKGSLPKVSANPQETTIISMSAPFSSVSTDSGSSAKDDHSRQANRVGRKLRSVQGIQSSVLSPGSASSLRRSPRFKVKK